MYIIQRMPVYHFTIHAYGTWMPDHPRGYVRRGEGIQAPSRGMARSYRKRATEQAVRFGVQEQQTLAWIAYDACTHRGWRLHGIAHDASHVHVLMSWGDETLRTEVFRKLKNLMSRELGLRCDAGRRHWFVRSGSRRRVTRREHFDYLMNVYFPGHRGLVWREGEGPPEPPPDAPTSVGG